ncbi:MAG: hypothetical protein ACI8QS_003754, partial [Planctomycetota bacterium]
MWFGFESPFDERKAWMRAVKFVCSGTAGAGAHIVVGTTLARSQGATGAGLGQDALDFVRT